jgi:hypothetical protein
MFHLKSKLTLIVFSLLIVIFLNSCNSSADASVSGTYPVDTIFSGFYNGLGDDTVLGPAISPAFINNGITYQYVVSGLMAYDPNLSPLDRFYFSPIATIEWNINDLPEPKPLDPGLPYINGHTIWEEIWPFYSRYGSNILGLPVTSVKANDEEQRYEQYFEGIGFYRKYSNPPGQFSLLPYGSWMCGENCQYQESDNSIPPASYSRNNSETEQLFLQASQQLGYGYTGEPLVPPQLGTDGNFEMVFENVILFIDSANNYQIKLRPLPSLLGIQADEPTIAMDTDWLSFYQVSDGLGYNVPNIFSDYISTHGGASYSGIPITEYSTLMDGGYTQCFSNLCLEYHPTAPEDLDIRPHGLGREYQTKGSNTTTATTESSFTDALQINVWEQNPFIASGERQIINIEAMQNNQPVEGVEFSLVVKQPDGIEKSYGVNPTGDDGKTSVELDPINGPNASIVQYEVCVLAAVTPQICFLRNYTIWDQ